MTISPASDEPNPIPNPQHPPTPLSQNGAAGGAEAVVTPLELAELGPVLQRAALPPELLERIRQLATAGCQSLHTVEAEAREVVRLSQEGARTTVKHELDTNKAAQKRAVKELKKAKRDADAIEPKVRVPDDERRITVVMWMLIVLSILSLLGGVLLEQFGAAKMLVGIGAFGVESMSEALLITSTALAVGAALTFGYRQLRWRWRPRVIVAAALALVGLFAIYVYNFAGGVARAEREHRQATDGLVGGDSVGDGGELPPEPVAEGYLTDSDSSEAWLTFFCLLGMIPCTLLLGHAGVDHWLDSFHKFIRNPELDPAMDLVALRDGEVRRLEARMGALRRQLAQLDDEENATLACARSQFLIECARSDSRNS